VERPAAGAIGMTTDAGAGTLFDRIAAARPERVAVQSPDGTLTYAQLVRRARFLATRLGERAAPVLVYGHKQPAMLVAFLAALRLGRAYVPADSALPPARITSMLDLARPGVAVAAEELPAAVAAALAARGIPTILSGPLAEGVDSAGSAPAALPEGPPGSANPTAYIIFTSGTTGDPKGVPIPCRALEHFTRWLIQTLRFTLGEETFLNQAPFNFDLSVMDLYGALLTGSTLFSITREEVADPRLLFARLTGAPLTVWVSTPSFARFCLAEPRFRQEMLPALRRFLFCGETLPPAVAGELARRFPAAEVWNTYGPTEATVAVTAVRVTNAMTESGRPLPVGAVAAGMDVWIADPEAPLRRLPAGTSGELVIAGPQVSPGYVTSATMGMRAGPFVPLPDGGVAYRTGDLGYIDPADGLLYCAGRLDRQVKLHGYRLELEEIEAHLRRLPGVADAAVLTADRDGRPDYLVAFVAPGGDAAARALPEGTPALTRSIRGQLAEVLPAYALPRRVHLLPALPLTANGKLDRRALSARTQ
jgi:D-alanine--poly(phosphoribitol) ligase subunit 1